MPKILVIDDRADNLLSVKAILKSYEPDYEVITAQSGMEGIDLAVSEKPDTILLDVQMPEMDGYEVCRSLRSNKKTQQIPIIFLTATHTSSEKRIKGLEMGGDAYLTKPIDAVELMANLQVMLRIKKAEDENLRRYEHIVSSSSDMMALLDKQFTYLVVNKQYAKAYNMIPEQLIGLTPTDVVGEDIFQTTIKPHATKCLNGESVKYETSIDIPSLGMQVLEINYSPFYDENNKVDGFVVNGRNITNRKLAEDDRNTILYELELVNRVILEINQAGSIDSMAEILAKAVYEINPGCHAAVSLYDEQAGGVQIKSVIGLDKNQEIIIKALGKDPRKIIFDPQKLDKVYTNYTTGKLVLVKGGLAELMAGHVPRYQCIMAEKLMGLEAVYTAGFASEEMAKGGVVLLLKKGQKIKHPSAVETLVAQTSQVIQRKQYEGQLKLSEQKYKSLVEFSPDMILLADLKGFILESNNAVDHHLGYPRNDIVGKHFSKLRLLRVRDLPKYTRILKSLARGETHAPFDAEVKHKDGSVRFLEIYVSIANIPGRNALLQVIAHDITERKQAEKALRQSQEQLHLVTHQSPNVFELYDLDGLQIDVNKAYEDLWDFPAETTVNKFNVLKSQEVVNSGLIDSVQRAYSGETVKVGEYIFDPRGATEAQGKGRVRWLSTKIYPLKNVDGEVSNIVITHEDVTDRKQAEAKQQALESQLLQSQKLEAVGTMIGGISHELNNILQSMFLYGGLVQEELPDKKSLQSNMQHLLEGGERARDIVKQVLTFSRKSKIDMKPQIVHELVLEALILEKASLPANISLIEDVEVSPNLVECDKTYIHQIVFNLCNNAIHAMEATGGILTVSLHQIQAALNSGKSKTNVQELTVQDTGHGINPDDLDKIFDPFFTTKQLGEGTGLGLSVIHGIVEMMQGQITVVSKLGRGTTFRILLPVTEKSKIDAPPPQTLLSSDGLKQSILLVDDETSIREITQAILLRKGFAVESASDGQKALNLFNAHPNKYNLIVTDLSMPIMSGIELCRAIRASGSDIPIMLSTGQLDIEDQQEYANIGITKSIQKPWTAEELIASIQEIDNK